MTLKDALEEYDTETAKKKFGACTSVTKSETRNIETQQKESAQTNAAAAAQPPANENPKNNDNSASNATNNKAANNQQRPNQAQQQTQAKSNATAGNANMADKAHIMNQERQVSSAQTNPHHGTKTPAPVNPNLPNNSHAVVSATPVDRTLHSRNEGAAALNNRLGAPPKMNLPPAQSRQSFPPSCGTLLPFQQQNGLIPPPPLSATERLNQGMFAGINSQQQNMNKENTSLNDYKSAPNSNIQMARPETSKGRNTGSGGAKRPTPVVEAQGQPTQKRANPYRPY